MPETGLKDILKFISCTIELTFQCNCRCPFCYQDNLAHKELSTKDFFRVINKLEESGIISLVFTGGEPLVRKDFQEIYKYAYKRGFQIGLLTNGINLGLKKFQKLFSLYPPARVMVSMNAISDETHFKVTRTKNNLKKVLSGIDFILNEKIQLAFQITLTKLNVHELDKIVSFAKLKKIGYIVTTNICDSLNGLRKNDIESLRLRPGVVQGLSCKGKIAQEIAHKDRVIKNSPNKFNCALVERSFWIDPQGNTFICAMYRDAPRLNILKSNVDRLFNLHQDIVFRSEIRPKECHKCDLLEDCNFACNASLRRAKLDTPEEFKYICESVRSIQNTRRECVKK